MFSWNQLHRGVKAIFFIQIVNRMGDFVVPFLTLILTQVQGFNPGVAGLVVTLATAMGSLGGLVAGKLSDHLSRRDVLFGFLGTSGLLLGFCGFAPASPWALVAMVTAEFFLGAMRPALGALVADLSAPETRRAAFSLSYLGINLGVSVGPLLAGWLFLHALSWLFWLDALSTAAALAILVRFVPRHTHPTAAPRDPGAVPRSSLAVFFRHRVLLPLSLLFLVYNFVYAQLIFTLALQMVALFGKQGPANYGLVWAVNGMAVLALTPLALRFTKTWTNLGSMALGMAFFAVGIAIFLFEPSLLWVLVSAVFWTAGEVLVSIHYGDLVTSVSPPEFRGRFQGYVGFLGGLGFVISPLASGLIAEAVGLTGAWGVATVSVALVGIGFKLLESRTPR